MGDGERCRNLAPWAPVRGAALPFAASASPARGPWLRRQGTRRREAMREAEGTREWRVAAAAAQVATGTSWCGGPK